MYITQARSGHIVVTDSMWVKKTFSHHDLLIWLHKKSLLVQIEKEKVHCYLIQVHVYLCVDHLASRGRSVEVLYMVSVDLFGCLSFNIVTHIWKVGW